MSSTGGPFDGYDRPGAPYGGGAQRPANPYGDGTGQSPGTHPAPGAPPSSSAAPYETGPGYGYQRPGSYAAHGGYPGTGPATYPPLAVRQNAAGGWSLALGIATVVLCMVPVLSQLVAIAGIVVGGFGRKAANEGRADNGGMALAGIILSVAGLAIGLLFWGFMAALVS